MKKHRIVSAYGSGIEKTREEREASWFELGKIIAGCETVEVVYLKEDMNAQAGDANLSGVIPGLRE